MAKPVLEPASPGSRPTPSAVPSCPQFLLLPTNLPRLCCGCRNSRWAVQPGRNTEQRSEGTLVPRMPRRTLTFPQVRPQGHIPGCCSRPRRASVEASELSSEGSQVPAHSLAPRSLAAGTRRGPPGAGPSAFTEGNESCCTPRPLHSSHYDERAPQSGARAVIFPLQHERFVCLTNQFFGTDFPAYVLFWCF